MRTVAVDERVLILASLEDSLSKGVSDAVAAVVGGARKRLLVAEATDEVVEVVVEPVVPSGSDLLTPEMLSRVL